MEKGDTDWFEFVSEENLGKLRLTGDILYEGRDRDAQGRSIPIFLTKQALLQALPKSQEGRDKKKGAGGGSYGVLLGPPSLLPVLQGMSDVQTTNVWVSMQSKSQFQDMAASMAQRGVGRQQKRESREAEAGVGMGDMGDMDLGLSSSSLLTSSSTLAAALVEEAAADLSFYMQRASQFAFTILNSAGAGAETEAGAETGAETGAEAEGQGAAGGELEELRQILDNLRV
ncbi:hypothetical protein B484DRAFT_483061 [Ochromonadaceae sp. CCMP2298]|nr:hypothetical protein B484DRAFT_483061 [Ochromonadaceae sp. CCMP2298]